MSTEAASASVYSNKNPFPARHKTNFKLTGSASEKDTRHHEISLAGSGLKYDAGDAMGLVVTNCPALADELVAALKAKGDEPVPGRDGTPKPLRAALFQRLRDYFCRKKFVEACVTKGASDLAPLLTPEKADDLKKFLTGRNDCHDYVDILQHHPQVQFTPEEFIKLLRKLPPRPLLDCLESQCAPGGSASHGRTVRYNIRGRERKGVASTFLAERWEGDTTAGVFMQSQQKHFFLPPDKATPIIMVGPAPASRRFAPFSKSGRSRVPLERTGSSSANSARRRISSIATNSTNGWRTEFSGSISPFHAIRNESLRAASHGRARRGDLGVASGRRGLLRLRRQEQDGRGRGPRVHKIAEVHGGKTPEQAKEYIDGLKKAKRYKRDVY
jgi:sulfite reductase (NADPH) flavoprotein alpha-component